MKSAKVESRGIMESDQFFLNCSRRDTPSFLSGFDKSGDFRIGATTAWVTDTIRATSGFLEFRGEGLSVLKRRIIAAILAQVRPTK